MAVQVWRTAAAIGLHTAIDAQPRSRSSRTALQADPWNATRKQLNPFITDDASERSQAQLVWGTTSSGSGNELGNDATLGHDEAMSSPFAPHSSTAPVAMEGTYSSAGLDEAISRPAVLPSTNRTIINTDKSLTALSKPYTVQLSGAASQVQPGFTSARSNDMGNGGAEEVTMHRKLDSGTITPPASEGHRHRRSLRALLRAALPIAASVLFNKWHSECKLQRWHQAERSGAGKSDGGIMDSDGAAVSEVAAVTSALTVRQRAGKAKQQVGQAVRGVPRKVEMSRDWCAVIMASGLSLVLN